MDVTNIMSMLLQSTQEDSEATTYQKLTYALANKFNCNTLSLFVLRKHPKRIFVRFEAVWRQDVKKSYCCEQKKTLDEIFDGEFADLQDEVNCSQEQFVYLPQSSVGAYYNEIYLFVFHAQLSDEQLTLLQLQCQNIASALPTFFQLVKLKENVISPAVSENNHERSQLQYSYSNILGDSEPILKILRFLDNVIMYSDTSDLLYINGESGTGKSLLARAIHKYSSKVDGPFIEVNCGALVENLCEIELFGIAPNSGISGAPEDGRSGLFEMANNGILFLDEVSELSLSMQAALLHVLDTFSFRRVCGTENINVDIQIISASSLDIKKLDRTQFLPELAERLDGLRIYMPPLRERKEDISALVQCFCKDFPSQRSEKIDDEMIQLMTQYEWPGNIRQLHNCVRQCSFGCVPDYLLQSKEIMLEAHLEKTLDEILDNDIKQVMAKVIKEQVQPLLQRNPNMSMEEVSTHFSITRHSFNRRLKAIGSSWKQLKSECL